jgi:hypothetical protein
MGEAAWNEGPILDEAVAAVQFHEKEKHVGRDQTVGHDWRGSERSIVIADREHAGLIL